MKKQFGLIGYPLSHSLSPFIQKRLFELNGICADYNLSSFPKEEFGEKITDLKQLDGFNVTIPHKKTIMDYLDEISDDAAIFGTVNTVKKTEKGLVGFNTDGYGFLKALQMANIPLEGKVLIYGYGGVARTVAYCVLQNGCDLTVCTRNSGRERAAELVGELTKKFGKTANVIEENEITEHYDLFVNCTPVGMFPNADASPVSENQVSLFGAVFDTIYNPTETKLLKFAKKQNKPYSNGLSMLVAQGAKAQSIWCDVSFTDGQIAKITAEAEKKLCSRDKNIVLVGFMGSGKTTVSKIIAKALNMELVDTDALIEEKYQMSVNEIFEKFGEEEFRKAENLVAEELSLSKGKVISCGGGMPVFTKCNALFENALTVYLEITPETAIKRLEGDTERPLLNQPNREEKIAKMLEKRSPIYEKVSNLRVNAAENSENVAKTVISAYINLE